MIGFSSNIADVIRDVDREIARQRAVVEREFRTIMVQALADVQTASPVDTGLYRAYHILTVGQPSEETAEEGSAVAGGAAMMTMSRMSEARESMTALDASEETWTVWLTNNLPYAWALEYGHSPQAAPLSLYFAARDNVQRRWDDFSARSKR
jgi:hypothetical protein